MQWWLLVVMTLSFAALAEEYSEPMSSSETEELSEPLCRDRAKEIARKHYDLCLKRVKQQEMQRLHQEYKDRIENLKNEYEREIERLKEDEAAPEPPNKPTRRIRTKKKKQKVADLEN